MSKTLVTGGAGFIGSHLVDALLSDGGDIVILDNLSSGIADNLQKHENLMLIRGDVRDFDAVKSASQGCERIFHLAEYLPNTKSYGPGHVVKYSFEAPLQDFEVSVLGTLNVLEAARRADAKVVFTSTAAVYGTPKRVPINEDDPKDPVSPYGMSKYVAEQYCSMYVKLYGLDARFGRIFNTFGPRQRKYVAYDLIEKIRKNPRQLELLGNGEESRDFIYVKDTVAALLLIAEKGQKAIPYNIGNGVPVSIEKIARTICEILCAAPEIRFTGSSWAGDIQSFYADNSRLKSLGYSPGTSLEDGLRNLVEWTDSLGDE